jgi:hypothetical protein
MLAARDIAMPDRTKTMASDRGAVATKRLKAALQDTR